MEAIVGFAGLILILWLMFRVMLLKARLSGIREAMEKQPRMIQQPAGNGSPLLTILILLGLLVVCLTTTYLIFVP
jgi:hypothetical protein